MYYLLYFSDRYAFHINTYILVSNVISSKSQIQLTNLGYKEMAGTYKCTVTSIGGQNSESSILDVYCK